MRARVQVFLKPGLHDPPGQAIRKVLESMGDDTVNDCHQGKMFVLDLKDGLSREEAGRRVDQICKKLLANSVIENYTFEILDA